MPYSFHLTEPASISNIINALVYNLLCSAVLTEVLNSLLHVLSINSTSREFLQQERMSFLKMKP